MKTIIKILKAIAIVALFIPTLFIVTLVLVAAGGRVSATSFDADGLNTEAPDPGEPD